MKISKLILRGLALLLLLACMPGMALAEKATINKNTYVYQKPSTSSNSIKVKKGLDVELVAVEDGWAMIENKGNFAFIPSKYLSCEEPEQEKEEEKEEEKDDSASVEMYDEPKEAVISDSTYVYQKASSSSARVKVSEGTQVDVLGVSGSWAMVESKGKRAFINKKYLEERTEAEDSAVQESEKEESSMSLKEMFSSGKFSNEELCYAFAVKQLGYNTAAAAGLLANIKAESNFRTNANGDAGKSYGICQWYSSRKTRLLNWCEGKGYDPSQLYAQLFFLEYELENYYPSVHRYMKNVSDTASGAYDAAYYFCYNFEAPANKASKSASRGSSAQNTFYPRYEGVAV